MEELASKRAVIAERLSTRALTMAGRSAIGAADRSRKMASHGRATRRHHHHGAMTTEPSLLRNAAAHASAVPPQARASQAAMPSHSIATPSASLWPEPAISRMASGCQAYAAAHSRLRRRRARIRRSCWDRFCLE